MPLSIEYREDQPFTFEGIGSLAEIIKRNYPFSIVSPEDSDSLREIEAISKMRPLNPEEYQELQRIGSVFLNQVNEIYRGKRCQ